MTERLEGDSNNATQAGADQSAWSNVFQSDIFQDFKATVTSAYDTAQNFVSSAASEMLSGFSLSGGQNTEFTQGNGPGETKPVVDGQRGRGTGFGLPIDMGPKEHAGGKLGREVGQKTAPADDPPNQPTKSPTDTDKSTKGGDARQKQTPPAPWHKVNDQGFPIKY